MLKTNPISDNNTFGEFPLDVIYNGTPYTLDVVYDLGGYNQFTSEFNARGYYLTIARGTSQEQELITGGGKLFLNEVGRQSKKQANIAKQLANDKLESTIQLVDERNQARSLR